MSIEIGGFTTTESAGTNDTTGVHLWLILMKSFHAIEDYAAADLRASGLGDSDFRVLEVLLHKGPQPVNAIGPKVFLTPGSISTAVDRLYAKGLVSRTECQQDRRVRTVDLTAKGRKLILEAFARHKQSMENLADVLKPSERIQVTNALRKLGQAAANRNTSRE